MPINPIQPFLKWPGGKRWASSAISRLVKEKLKRKYFEPFLGGGAVFFTLQPQESILSDINTDLINVYRAVRDHQSELTKSLKYMRVSHSEYYRIRSSNPRTSVNRAARFLYLNRTSFSGLYRVNSSGKFNVPYGGGDRTHEILIDTPLLLSASIALKNVSLKCCDFEEMLEDLRRGDVAYCDPTYTVTHDQNGFIRYNERNFSWADQMRLAVAAYRALRRGANVFISNACHSAVKELYSKARFLTLERQSTLSADPEKRRPVKEYLICL